MDVIALIEGLKRSDENLIQGSIELDKAIDHIVQLIRDACSLYSCGSFASSAFFGITACEEVAKAHIGLFTDGNNPAQKGRNFFRDHNTKHKMAALPTVPMGHRLGDAIGERQLQRIMKLAQNSGFVKCREDFLYFRRQSGILIVPKEKIDKKFTRALALFAIEVFDDALVGLTNHSFEAGEITDALFETVKNT